MKKEVFFNGRFLTQAITGVQRTAYELVLAIDNLVEQGMIDKNIYSFKLIYSGKIINQIELKHIKVVKKGFLKGNLWEQLELPFYTRKCLLISMCTISSLFKRNQIVIVHDASFLVNTQFFSFIFRTWYRVAIIALGKIAKQIVTVSNFSKSELIKHAHYKSGKISVIYNAAEHILRYNEPEDDFKNKVSHLKPYCLAVSSLGANKNFDGLSQALKKVNFNGFNMLVAGGITPTLQSGVRDSSINYLGYVSNEELKFLYTNASIFIFPSFYEGFGIPPLEAMISGCPCISSNTSSLQEVLGNACEYFDPKNIQDMASKIDNLINNTDRQRYLRKVGSERALLYSWKKSAVGLYRLMVTMA